MIFSFLFPFLLMFSINVLAMDNALAVTLERCSSSEQLSYLNSSCSDISLGGISVGSLSSLVRNPSSSSIGKTYDPRMQAPPPELIAAMMQASSEERQLLLKMEEVVFSGGEASTSAAPAPTEKLSPRTCSIMLMLLHKYEGDELKGNLKNLLKQQGYSEEKLDQLADEVLKTRSPLKKNKKLKKRKSRSLPEQSIRRILSNIHEEDGAEPESYEPSRSGICIKRPLLKKRSRSFSTLPQAETAIEAQQHAQLPKRRFNLKKWIPKRFRKQN